MNEADDPTESSDAGHSISSSNPILSSPRCSRLPSTSQKVKIGPNATEAGAFRFRGIDHDEDSDDESDEDDDSFDSPGGAQQRRAITIVELAALDGSCPDIDPTTIGIGEIERTDETEISYSKVNKPDPILLESAATKDDDKKTARSRASSTDDLVVAMPVDEDDDDEELAYDRPSAEAYNPSEHKAFPLTSVRFYRYYLLILFCVVVLAIGIGVGVSLSKREEDSDKSFEIRQYVELVIGTEGLQDLDSPYSLALEWIVYNDTLKLTVQDANLIQRYILAYFYFATTRDGPWLSCNPSSGDGAGHCNFKQMSTSHTPTEYLDLPAFEWLSKNPECLWAGVKCDDQERQVYGILSGAHKLSGRFPDGLSHLPFLQELFFQRNSLSGPLSIPVSEMYHLDFLDVSENSFTGKIPDEMWTRRKLWRLSLGYNQLSGFIPSTVGNLQDLKGLLLNSNKLHGSIPNEIGNLDSLTYFRALENDLEGNILPESAMKNWGLIREIWLDHNKLTGPISKLISRFNGTLEDLNLSENLLTGPIPEEIYSLTLLYRLDLSRNQLTGTLSPAVGNLTLNANEISLTRNFLSGAVPQEISNLGYLESLYLNGNDFSGSIPPAICSIQGGEILEVFVADCRASMDGVAAELECSCCTVCCDANGRNCGDSA